MSSNKKTKYPNWLKFLLNEDSLDYLDNELLNIRKLGTESIAANTMFFQLSRNPGIGLMFLNASGENIQIVHHPTVIGGSWQQKEQKVIALSGLSATPATLRFIPKSIKQIQTKAPLVTSNLKSQDLKSVKCAKSRFDFKNIIPLPISLLRTFITLSSTDPASVAKAFILKLHNKTDNISNDKNHTTTAPVKTPDDHNNDPDPTEEDIKTSVTSLKSNETNTDDTNVTNPLELCSHILQFLYLLHQRKNDTYSLHDPKQSRSNQLAGENDN